MTIAEIKQQITDAFIADETIIEKYNLQEGKSFEDQFSRISFESILFYIFAVKLWITGQEFDAHKKEVETIIATMKPHTARWYASIAKLFQYGDDLPPDTDKYDNSNKTDEEIEASKIVAYSAVVEVGKQLVVKVAKDVDDLAPLDNTELAAFSEYIARVKDAGVNVGIVSASADNLKLEVDIYYNPLVLNQNGQQLDGAIMTPVDDAIRNYLKNLPFNGELVLAYLTDALQLVDGIVIPHIRSASYQYGDLDYNLIEVKCQPYAGYLRISDDNLKINYIPQTEIR